MNNAMLSNSLIDAVGVLFRHKGKILGAFLVVSAIGLIAACLRPSVYSADTKLMVRLGRENLSVDPSVSGPTMNPIESRDNDLNSELTILTSRSLAEQLVDTLGEDKILGKSDGDGGGAGAKSSSLTKRVVGGAKSAVSGALKAANILPALTPHDKAVKRVMSSLNAQIEKRTNIISASFEAGDPELARVALDRLVGLYQERHIQVYSAQARPSFFEDQSDRLRVELEKREKALDKFREDNGIMDMERQKDVMLERISAIETDVDDAAAGVSESEARIAELEKALAGRSKTRELSRTTGRTNNAADTLKTKLAELRLQRTDMAGRYPQTHRPLIQLNQQIAEIESSLAKEEQTLTEVTTGVDPNYEQLLLSLQNEKAQLKAKQARQDLLTAELKLQEEGIAVFTGNETELNSLTRDVELAEKEYRQYLENFQRAKVSSALDMDKVSNISVVQAAAALPYPVRPNRLIDIFLAMCVGLFVGVFWAFAAEYYDDSVKGKEQFEKQFDVPVLAVIEDKVFKSCS